MNRRVRRSVWILLLSGLLGACATPPDPGLPKPAREAIAGRMPVGWKLEEGWQAAQPRDAVDRNNWWTVFGDPELDRLQAAARGANANLQVAAGRLELARTQVSVVSASLSPELRGVAGAQRLRSSADRPQTNYAVNNLSTTQNDYTLSLQASYEVDLFGRVRSSVEAAQASADQAAADLENVRLVVAAEIAINYFTLRALDAEIATVDEVIDTQRKALELLRTRHQLGVASALESSQQQASIDAAITQRDLLSNQRGRLEDALATLTGTPAPEFRLPARAGLAAPPAIPVGLPSDLLERRPDVASAERAMAAANAQIGVARAAFFPRLTLSPTVGWDSRRFPRLLGMSSLLWTLGGSAVQTLFDSGRNQALYEASEISWKMTAAAYRQTVLVAMQEVQDGINSGVVLQRAQQDAQTAVRSSRRVLEIATARYEGGVATFLDVLTAQQQLLNNRRLSVQIAGQQLLVSVQLVKALGGGWGS